MKIPGEKTNQGYDRLMMYRKVIDACFHSHKKRVEQYETLKHYWLYGCSPDGDATPYNKIEPIIDTLTAFLYSADSTRFSVHLSPDTPPMEWDKAQPVAKSVNAEWLNTGADQIFSQGLDMACVYGSSFIKTIVKSGHMAPYVVEPHCLGVYREDINGLDRQEAIAHRYYITKSQLETELESHPNRDKILAQLPARPMRAQDEMPEGLRRIIVTNLAGVPPLTPGNQVTGNGTLFLTDRVDYVPDVAPDMVEMTELWIYDDDIDGKGRSDWRTVTMAEGPAVIYDRPNIFVPGEQPFTQICPMPLNGYFWGASFAAKLTGLQGWRNIRVDEIMRILALQAKPPLALNGFSSIVDETKFSLDTPGTLLGNVGDPMGKVDRFDIKVPDDLWRDVGMIDEMFMEAAALPPLLMGRGETGVRSGRQTSELSRLGSSRIKKRALAVEDNLETLATKMFKAMRKYDDSKLYTVPAMPDKKPMAFILDQMPADTTIRVDAHSNSPLFVEDQKALAAEMLEARSIDRESFIEMLNPPQKDVLLRKLPGIEAKEQAAAKAAADHETQVAAAKHGPQGAPGGQPQPPGGAKPGIPPGAMRQ